MSQDMILQKKKGDTRVISEALGCHKQRVKPASRETEQGGEGRVGF